MKSRGYKKGDEVSKKVDDQEKTTATKDILDEQDEDGGSFEDTIQRSTAQQVLPFHSSSIALIFWTFFNAVAVSTVC